MQCSHCGSEQPDGSTFCANCGTNLNLAAPSSPAEPSSPVEPAATPANAVVEPAATPASAVAEPAPIPASAPEPAPRKHRKGLIIALALVVVLAIASMITWAVAGRDIKRAFLGVKKSYILIEGNQLRQSASDLVTDLISIGMASQQEKTGGQIMDMQVDFNDEHAQIDQQTLTALENIKLKLTALYDRQTDKPAFYNKLDFLVGDKSLMTVDSYYDQEQVIVGLPGILSSYLQATQAQLTDAMANNQATSGAGLQMGMLSQLVAAKPDVDPVALEQGLNKLIDILMANIESATFERGVEIKAGEVAAKYDCYTVKTTDAKARQMIIDLMKVLRDDPVFYKILGQAAQMSGTGAATGAGGNLTEEQWQKELSNAITNLETGTASTKKMTLTQKIYVDKNDQIHGRELQILDENSQPVLDLQAYMPIQDARHATLIRMKPSGQSLELLDLYTLAAGKKTGTLSLKSSEETLMTIQYQDVYQEKSGSASYMLGDFTIQLSASQGVAVPEIKIKTTLKDSRYQADLSISGMADLTIGVQKMAAKDITFPAIKNEPTVNMTDQQALQALLTPEVMTKLQEVMAAFGISPDMLQ
jgi:hypothetical protein